MGHWGTAAGAVSGHIDNHIEDLGSGIWDRELDCAQLLCSTLVRFQFQFNFHGDFSRGAHRTNKKRKRSRSREQRE